MFIIVIFVFAAVTVIVRDLIKYRFGALTSQQEGNMTREELRDGFRFVPMFNPFYIKDAIKVAVNFRSLEEYRDYILEHNIEKAEIVMPDLKILQLCPQLKYLRIHPSYNAPEKS